MRKIFVDDPIGFAFLLVGSVFSLVVLYNILPKFSVMLQNVFLFLVFVCVLVLFVIAPVWFLLRTKIISVNSKTITCIRLIKPVRLVLSEIDRIEESKHYTYMLDGLEYECWKIIGKSGAYITIDKLGSRAKRRQRIIDFIAASAGITVSTTQSDNKASNQRNN